jgi:hypothetical protein
VSNELNYDPDEEAARLRFQAKLDAARASNDYSFFREQSPEFYADMLDWIEFTAWVSKRDELGRERETARTLGVLSEIGAGISFLPIVGQVVGIPLAAAAGAAATAEEAGFAGYASSGVIQGGVVYGQGAAEQALTQGAQILQNAGTAGGKELVDAAKVSTPGANAQQVKDAEIDAAVTLGSTATVIGSAGVGGLVGDVVNVAGSIATKAGAFAARGDYRPEADLEFALGAATSLADFGAKELAGAASTVRSVVQKAGAAAVVAVSKWKPLDRRAA